jgi:hypothetical protein
MARLVCALRLRLRAGPSTTLRAERIVSAPTGLACVFNFSQALRPGLNSFAPSRLHLFDRRCAPSQKRLISSFLCPRAWADHGVAVARWPIFATGLPGEFAWHVRIEALKYGEAVWVIVVKPAGIVDPIPIVAGMHGPKLHVKVPDNVRVSFAGLELFSGLYAISDGIDHAVPQAGGLVENDDFGMFVVVEKASGIGPEIAFLVCPRGDIHYVPAVFVDDLEKFLVEFCVAVTRFGIEWHANRSLTEKRIYLCAPLRCARAFGRAEGFHFAFTA